MELFVTNHYLFLLDKDARINKGDYYLYRETDIFKCEMDVCYDTQKDVEYAKGMGWRILAYFPLKESVKSLDLTLLPDPFIIKDEIKDLAHNCDVEEQYLPKSATFYYGFLKGYKAAKAKQFSIEDMYRMLDVCKDAAMEFKNTTLMELKGRDLVEELLKPKLPDLFVPNLVFNDKGITVPQISLNSENREVMVGNYYFKDTVDSYHNRN